MIFREKPYNWDVTWLRMIRYRLRMIRYHWMDNEHNLIGTITVRAMRKKQKLITFSTLHSSMNAKHPPTKTVRWCKDGIIDDWGIKTTEFVISQLTAACIIRDARKGVAK